MKRILVVAGIIAAIANVVVAMAVFGMQSKQRIALIYPAATDIEGYMFRDAESFALLFTTSDPIEKVKSYYSNELSNVSLGNITFDYGAPLANPPFCSNLNYAAHPRGGCYEWLWSYERIYDTTLPTLGGTYYIRIDTLPSYENSTDNYFRIGVGKGSELHFSCGFCP